MTQTWFYNKAIPLFELKNLAEKVTPISLIALKAIITISTDTFLKRSSEKYTIWEYSKAFPLKIKTTKLANIDWEHEFRGLYTNKTTDLFTSKLHSILSRCIPSKTIKCNDKVPPCFNSQIKTAIKRKHKVYSKYLKRGRKPEDKNEVKAVRNETSKMITAAKEQCYYKLGQKLSSSQVDTKTYWSVFNKILNNKLL